MRYTTGRTVERGVMLALVGILGLCMAAEAQVASYAVKFVCGTRSSDAQVVSGVYATTVNIHNPHREAVKFRKKAVVGLPQRSQTPGPIAEFVDEELPADGALGMDCRDIRELFSTAPPSFIEGFVVIHVAPPRTGGEAQALDVVGVYTARHRTGDGAPSAFDVETIAVEEVRPKILRAQVDLLPIPNAQESFCKRNPDTGRLVVTVKNQGPEAAGPSKTEVDFGDLGSQSKATPGLLAGASVNLSFSFPDGCFNPDCSFTIQVDSGNVLTETDEGNNEGEGDCQG